MKPEEALIRALERTGMQVAAAESCTGGLICKRLTDVPGASAHVLGGCVTYTNEMKMRFLGVRPETLDRYTAVSEQTASEMSRGICKAAGADLGLAVTGYAGPDSSPECPAGRIFVSVCCRGQVDTRLLPHPRGCDRSGNREAAADFALALGLEAVRKWEDGTF